MKKSQLRTALGLFLVIAHFVSFVQVLLWTFAWHGYLFEEMTTAVAIILPMFAVYSTPVIKSIIEHASSQTPEEEPTYNFPFVFISFFLPTLFVLTINAMIYLWGVKQGFSDIEQFKISLGITETTFALYLGTILSSIFDRPIPEGPQGTPAPSPS